MSGLLEAIASTAELDEQIGEGKALSEREVAVLQAPELLTHGRSQLTWIKANDLRERVTRLLGQTSDRMGDGQWLGFKSWTSSALS